jgi:SRSO17 transposase
LLEDLKATVAGLFGRREPRGTFWDLVTGLLMGLPTANCRTIAEAAGHRGPHRLQHLLSRAVRDAEAVLAGVASWTLDHLTGPAILAVDETGDAKSPTVGAAQQYSAVAACVRAQYVTADEVYGSVAFRTACRAPGLAYVVACRPPARSPPPATAGAPALTPST